MLAPVSCTQKERIIIHTGWGMNLLRAAPERNLRVLVGEELGMSWQCELAAQKAKCILDCIKNMWPAWVRERILFFHSALLRPHVEGYIQVWGLQYKRDMDPLDQV